MSQMHRSPVVALRHKMSACPSPLKSTVAAICQLEATSPVGEIGEREGVRRFYQAEFADWLIAFSLLSGASPASAKKVNAEDTPRWYYDATSRRLGRVSFCSLGRGGPIAQERVLPRSKSVLRHPSIVCHAGHAVRESITK